MYIIYPPNLVVVQSSFMSMQWNSKRRLLQTICEQNWIATIQMTFSLRTLGDWGSVHGILQITCICMILSRPPNHGCEASGILQRCTGVWQSSWHSLNIVGMKFLRTFDLLYFLSSRPPGSLITKGYDFLLRDLVESRSREIWVKHYRIFQKFDRRPAVETFVIHSWQKRLLHPGMMCLFCDYFYFISPRGLRTGCLV